MTHRQTVIRLRALGALLVGAALTSLVFATEAAALTIDPDDPLIVVDEPAEPSELPVAPEPPADEDVDVAERIATVPPDEFFPLPSTTVVPRNPKVDAANFGIGWPAAIAAGIAVGAVLIMALVWRRDEPGWVRSSPRR